MMKRFPLVILILALVLCGGMSQAQSLAPSAADSALAPKPLPPKAMDVNPYILSGDSNIHIDSYNSDTTDQVMPLAIFPEINMAFETECPNASPSMFFDGWNHSIVPYLGGIAMRDLNGVTTRTLGRFLPRVDDTEGYAVQCSYSFTDAENRIVCPTSHNHVIMLRATDENGAPLPVFEKVLDIDVMAEAERALGKPLDQNLLSIVYDYEGNLWFATGGFRIYPERKQTGTFGYISRAAIDAVLAGETVDLSKEVHVYETAPGEGAENGIASSKEGTVILTNLACYLLRADDGVELVWRTPYESLGAKDSRADAATTGGGLAWGSGCSPSLTRDLVFFTDNLDPINLIALDMKTGEKVASLPVIDELPPDMPVSLENSVNVYDDGAGTVSVIVCNWFGAGSANLAKPDSDSSIQTYENIYDANWIAKGNIMIMPGVERVDTVKTESGYEMRSVWCRNDLRDTSMLKLSTATGYLYGYVQDMESGMWQFVILDFETGQTAFTADVSSLFGYNNMAIGVYAGASGNVLYCPTGYREMLRLQDRFAYLPQAPYRKLDLDKTGRAVLPAEQFAAEGGIGSPATWLHTVVVENAHPQTVVAIRVNGLTGSADDLALYAYGADGALAQVPPALWTLEGAQGALDAAAIYEIHITVEDGGALDRSADARVVTVSALLAAQ